MVLKNLSIVPLWTAPKKPPGSPWSPLGPPGPPMALMPLWPPAGGADHEHDDLANACKWHLMAFSCVRRLYIHTLIHSYKYIHTFIPSYIYTSYRDDIKQRRHQHRRCPRLLSTSMIFFDWAESLHGIKGKPMCARSRWTQSFTATNKGNMKAKKWNKISKSKLKSKKLRHN